MGNVISIKTRAEVKETQEELARLQRIKESLERVRTLVQTLQRIQEQQKGMQ